MMIEDKLKATDWEATDTAVAEQVSVLIGSMNIHCHIAQLFTGGGDEFEIFCFPGGEGKLSPVAGGPGEVKAVRARAARRHRH